MGQNPRENVDFQNAMRLLFEGSWCTKPASVLSVSADAGLSTQHASSLRAATGSLRTNADCAHAQTLSRRMKASKDFLSLCPVACISVKTSYILAAQIKFLRGI